MPRELCCRPGNGTGGSLGRDGGPAGRMGWLTGRETDAGKVSSCRDDSEVQEAPGQGSRMAVEGYFAGQVSCPAGQEVVRRGGALGTGSEGEGSTIVVGSSTRMSTRE